MEYVHISHEEKVYGSRSLLETEALFLDIIKREKVFKELRKKEILFKIELKQKIEETLSLLNELDKKLPKMHHNQFGVKEKESLSIEQELEKIKEKLERLQ